MLWNLSQKACSECSQGVLLGGVRHATCMNKMAAVAEIIARFNSQPLCHHLVTAVSMI